MAKKTSTRKKLSRRELRDLDVEIGFLEGVVRRDPRYVDALQILGDDYTRRGQYVKGLEVDRKLVELRPTDSMVHYNLACSYALIDRIELAAEALEQALLFGYRDFKWLAQDPDLANLRQHPIYRKIRAKLRIMSIKIS